MSRLLALEYSRTSAIPDGQNRENPSGTAGDPGQSARSQCARAKRFGAHKGSDGTARHLDYRDPWLYDEWRNGGIDGGMDQSSNGERSG